MPILKPSYMPADKYRRRGFWLSVQTLWLAGLAFGFGIGWAILADWIPAMLSLALAFIAHGFSHYIKLLTEARLEIMRLRAALGLPSTPPSPSQSGADLLQGGG